MSKWKRFGLGEPNDLHARAMYMEQRNAALDLLDEYMTAVTNRDWESLHKRVNALLDRLRVPEKCPNCHQTKDGAWVTVTDCKRPYCSECGRKMFDEPTVREQVTAIEGNVHSVRDTIRLLADEIDKLRAKK